MSRRKLLPKEDEKPPKSRLASKDSVFFSISLGILAMFIAIPALVVGSIAFSHVNDTRQATQHSQSDTNNSLTSSNIASIIDFGTNTVNITGTFAISPATTYQYINMRKAGSIVVIDSDQTPRDNLPLYDPNFVQATFGNETIEDWDVVQNAFYSDSISDSILITSVERAKFDLCLIDIILETPICFENGNYCDYPIIIEKTGQSLNSLSEVITYIKLNIEMNALLLDNGCFEVPILPAYYAYFGAASIDSTPNIPVRIPARSFIMEYSTAPATTFFGNIRHEPPTLGSCTSTLSVVPSNQDFFINYGDGTPEIRITGTDIVAPHTYIYPVGAPAIVNVTIYGRLPNWSFRRLSAVGGGSGPYTDLLKVIQWGNTGLTQVDFYRQTNLASLPQGGFPTTVEDMSFFLQLANPAPLQDIQTYDLSRVRFFTQFTQNANFDFNLNFGTFGMNSAEQTDCMFDNFNSNSGIVSGLNQWNTGALKSTLRMFRFWRAGQLDINSWNVTNVQNAGLMFESYNQGDLILNNWNLSKVTNIGSMFKVFTGGLLDVSNWNLPNAFGAIQVFNLVSATSSINAENWNLARATTITQLCLNGNAGVGQFINLSNWNLPLVTTATSIFQGFNNAGNSLNITNWKFGTDPINMNTAFQQFSGISLGSDLLTWDVSSVTRMENMFQQHTATGTLDLSTWTLTSLQNSEEMFQFFGSGTTLLTTNWTTTPSLGDVDSMFRGFESSVSPIIANWDVSGFTDCDGFINFSGSGPTFIPTEYDAILAKMVETPPALSCNWNNVQMQYTAAGLADRTTLIGRGWTITDLGQIP